MTDQTLPTDPEGLNDRRAEWAEAALAAFILETGTDREDAPGDLLANLMHWCDRNQYNFEAALERARGDYHHETLGE